MSTRLHVGNIANSVEELELRGAFSRFGPVETVAIAMDSMTGRHKGFATVVMSSSSDADSAIRAMNFSQYAGRTIGVSRARLTDHCKSTNGGTPGDSTNVTRSSRIFDE
ncbi:MAG: RNA-binding protein [Gammaproteobacteria bacterium]|nr:RNA-binding protein [Gammaproteobacteria bacterium]MDH4255225.1 RNA-binding protein [Gammaproteobacteria bacterium]MDH5310881.1 RNA-binding protein [Gammaproteobacteria bacterium]